MVANQIEAWLGGMVLVAWADVVRYDASVHEWSDVCADIGWFEYDWLNGVRPLGWEWKEEIS